MPAYIWKLQVFTKLPHVTQYENKLESGVAPRAVLAPTADFVCLLPTAVLDCRANVDQLSSSRS